MKLLLSINKKFFEVNMKSLFDLIDKKDETKAIDGIELFIDSLTDANENMATLIAKKLKERNLKLQLHATALSKDVLAQYEFLKLYHKLAKIMDEKISVVYHPFESENIEDSRYLTNIIMKRIKMHIEDRKYDLTVTLENLDDVDGLKRLKLEDIYKIVKAVNGIGITYDIGHEVLENTCTYTIDSKYKGKIKNIHLHDITVNGLPHAPFYAKKTDIDKVAKLLKSIDYKGNIVAEISLDYLRGNTYQEKLQEYLEEMIKIKEKILN